MLLHEWGVQDGWVLGPDVQAVAAAELNSTRPAVVEGARGEDRSRWHWRNRACCVCGPDERGECGILGAEGRDMSDVRSAKCGLMRAGGPERAGIQGVKPGVWGICVRGSSIQRARRSWQRELGAWLIFGRWYESDGEGGWGCLKRKGHSHLFCKVLRLGHWYQVVSKDSEGEEILKEDGTQGVRALAWSLNM